MVVTAKFDAFIPKDNQDLTTDDLEFQSNSIHGAIAARQDDVDVDFSGGVKNVAAGVVYGMVVSYSAPNITVSPGVVFCNGMRGEFATAQSLALASVSLNDYLVARIGYTDGSPRVNPVTHVNDNMHRVFSCTLVAVALADIDTDTDVVLGKVTDVTTPLFGDRASWVYVSGGDSLTIQPLTSGGVALYGDAGNKYFVRFSVSPYTPITVQKLVDPGTMGFVYLHVQLKGSALGVVESTLAEIVAAINATPGYFTASFTGTDVLAAGLPTSVPTYTPFAGGSDYRKYYQVTVGSNSFTAPERFNPSDPFTKHLSQKGKGAPTENNPHGTTLADMGISEISTEAHIRREHYQKASLPRSVRSAFLEITLSPSNKLTVTPSSALDDACLIEGAVVSVPSTYTLEDPTTDFALYEIFVNKGGFANNRKLASYNDASAYGGLLPITYGASCVLSITDKKPDLTGTKVLYLTKTAGVSVAKLGVNGTAVDVSTPGEYILSDFTDNSWIKVYSESGAINLIADGAYANTVTFLAYSDVAEYPVALLSWDHDSWGYAGGAALWKDIRQYGSFSFNNDKFLDVANTIPSEFKPLAGITSFTAGSLNLVVSAFDFKYRGYWFNIAAVTFIATDSATSYLCATFDGRQGATLSLVSSVGYAHVSDRVVLAKVVTNATEVTSVVEAYYPGSYNSADKCFEFNVSTAEELLGALKAVNALPALYNPVIHVRENFTFDMSLIPTAVLDVAGFTLISAPGKITFTDTLSTTKYIRVSGILYLDKLKAIYSIKVFRAIMGFVATDCYVTTSGTLAFIETAAESVIKDSVIPVVDLSASYGIFRCIDSVITGSIIVQESGKLVFKGVDYKATTGRSLVSVTAEPTGAFDITVDDGRFSGSNLGLISLADTGWTVPADVHLSNSSFDYSSVITNDLGDNTLNVSAHDCYFNNFGFLCALDSTFKSYGLSSFAGEFKFKSADTATSFSDGIKMSILGGGISGVLDIIDFTCLEIDSSVVVTSDPMYKASVSSLIEIVGAVPDAGYLNLTWGAKTALIFYKGSTIRSMPINIGTESDFDGVMYFFHRIKYNNYTITLTPYGGSPYSGAADKDFTIKAISGNGSIVASGFTCNDLSVFNVSNNVLLAGSFVVTGLLYLLDSPFVGFSDLSMTYTAPTVNSRMILLRHSYLSVAAIALDGAYGAGDPSAYLVEVLQGSELSISSGTFAVSGGSPDAGAVAFIHVDSSSKITNLVATFDHTTYPIPVDSAYLVGFDLALGVYATDAVQAKIVEAFLSRLKLVDINLTVTMGSFFTDGFLMMNVGGGGKVAINGLKATYAKPVEFNNISLYLALGATKVDNSAAGSVPLTLTRCRRFTLGETDITVKAAATGLSLEINASNGSIAGILINGASTEFIATRLVAIKDNSSVDISETDSSACNVSFTPVTVSRSKVVHNLSTPYAGTDLSIYVTLGGQLFYRNISLAYALAMEGPVVVY